MWRADDNLSASKQACVARLHSFVNSFFVISREMQRRTIPFRGQVCRFALLWGGDAFGHRIT